MSSYSKKIEDKVKNDKRLNSYKGVNPDGDPLFHEIWLETGYCDCDGLHCIHGFGVKDTLQQISWIKKCYCDIEDGDISCKEKWEKK